MLVFDDGDFSEAETVLLSDSMAHIPREVLSKNFGVAEKAFDSLPRNELFIFQTDVPGPLEGDQKTAAGSLGASPQNFAFRTMEMPPTKRTKGGEVRIVDSSKFKASTTVAMAMVTVHAGGLRELHWHPNADEWQYYISGKGRMTVVSTGNRARTMDFQAGDVGYVQKTLLHYIENTGDTDLIFLEMFKSRFYQDLSLSKWLSHTPPELVMAHLKYRQGDAGCNSQRRVGDRAALVDVVMSQRRNRRLPLAWQPDVDSEPLLHFANLLG